MQRAAQKVGGQRLETGGLAAERVAGPVFRDADRSAALDWIPRLQFLVRKVHVLRPVEVGDVVFARANVISDVRVDRLVKGGHRIGWQPFESEQFVHRTGVIQRQHFSLRIRPLITLGTGHIHRSRGNQRQQHVVIDRQSRFVVVVVTMPEAKPMWEGCIDPFDGFPKSTA